MKLADLVAALDELLAPQLFDDYCPNGLQVEGRGDVATLVTGVTASQALLDAAVEKGADAVLVHHGYFWKGEDPTVRGMKRRRLATLLAHEISLIAYHLPLDAHPTLGNNARLAAVLGLEITGDLERGAARSVGFTGRLVQPMAGTAFACHLTQRLGRTPLHVPGTAEEIATIAWCTGGAQHHIEQAVDLGVDAYLTGEVSEPTVHVARETGLHFFAAGHHATERYGVQAVGDHAGEQFALRHHFIDIDNPA
jgi:dinuclear metal center YbgI/SA1388 family protein